MRLSKSIPMQWGKEKKHVRGSPGGKEKGKELFPDVRRTKTLNRKVASESSSVGVRKKKTLSSMKHRRDATPGPCSGRKREGRKKRAACPGRGEKSVIDYEGEGKRGRVPCRYALPKGSNGPE